VKKRYLYSLLYGIPGLLVSAITSLFIFGASAGFLWLFVFGDNPWPSSVGTALPFLFALVFLALWTASLVAGFIAGKRLEKDRVLNRRHVAASAGLTILLLLFIAFYQLRAGNIGPKSDSLSCADFCSRKGYNGSVTSPKISHDRTCSCLDNSGREVIKVPLESIESQ
jgi:hypothetical protein